ncbi:MAG: DNA glycosylase [Candidatus Woesearchaeota archaeon]
MKYPHFNLSATLDSGQIFRWKQAEEGFLVQHADQFFNVMQKDGLLSFQGTNPKFFNSFFALDFDYGKMLQNLQQFPELQNPLADFSGLRLLRQDPWECTVSFVCSANANIPKIRKNVHGLSERFGQKKTSKVFNTEFHTFPRIGELKEFEGIHAAGTGYRAKHIHELNSQVDKQFFQKLKNKSYDDARASLMELPGVGPKVADCVSLFSLQKYEAFPVDVHIKRAMEFIFFDGKPQKETRIVELGQERYGEYAGYAQQFLFHAMRKKTI